MIREIPTTGDEVGAGAESCRGPGARAPRPWPRDTCVTSRTGRRDGPHITIATSREPAKQPTSRTQHAPALTDAQRHRARGDRGRRPRSGRTRHLQTLRTPHKVSGLWAGALEVGLGDGGVRVALRV